MKFFETNQNKDKIDKNLWEAANAVLGGFIGLNANIKKVERSQVNNPT